MATDPRASRVQLIAYDVPLRPDLLVRLILPVELTEVDAERLCRIVRTLAMPASQESEVGRD